MKKISILIPAYNEEKNLENLISTLNSQIAEVSALAAYEWEYLFVNDGSRDNTLKMLEELHKTEPRVNYVNLSRNFGKENAMKAGMDYVSGDAVIIMDADLQHPVEVIPEMVYWWEKGYDDVYGRRTTRGKESWLRKKLSLTFYSMLQGTTRIEILQNVGDFRLLDRRVVDAIRQLPENQRYTKGLYCWVGYNKKEVLYEQKDRMEGESSFNFKGLLNLAIEGITCFTTAPLRMASVLGFVVSIIALVYIAFTIVKTIVWGDAVQGYPTLLCAILFLGGVQLISLGIIGEYIARIFNETKERPVYIVESFNGEKTR